MEAWSTKADADFPARLKSLRELDDIRAGLEPVMEERLWREDDGRPQDVIGYGQGQAIEGTAQFGWRGLRVRFVQRQFCCPGALDAMKSVTLLKGPVRCCVQGNRSWQLGEQGSFGATGIGCLGSP